MFWPKGNFLKKLPLGLNILKLNISITEEIFPKNFITLTLFQLKKWKKIQNSDGEKQKFPLRGLQYYDIFIHPHFRRRISLEKKRSKDGFFFTLKKNTYKIRLWCPK